MCFMKSNLIIKIFYIIGTNYYDNIIVLLIKLLNNTELN